MVTLYVVKSFGQYHYFKTAEERDEYLKTLPEYEQKCAELYKQTFGEVS